jgi:arylsulfatase A-like enzyme
MPSLREATGYFDAGEYLSTCIGRTITRVEDDENSLLFFLSDGTQLQFYGLEAGGFGVLVHEGVAH